jgi:predicted ribosome quality control (RQC) complex YloA/Tae2 family protein
VHASKYSISAKIMQFISLKLFEMARACYTINTVNHDLFLLTALARELDGALKDARVTKITQPDDTELRFSLYTKSGNLTLLISCCPQTARLHLTTTKRQAPQTAPPFCMLLRKHLSGARLVGVEVYNFDRIIRLEFLSKTELYEPARFFLYVELMGRYSNVILADEINVIIDAVFRRLLDSGRPALRGLAYQAPKLPKTCVFSAQNEDFRDLEGKNLESFLNSRFGGFSKKTVGELLYKAGLDGKKTALTDLEISALMDLISKFRNVTEQEYYAPCVVSGEVFPFPFAAINAQAVRNYPDLSQAIEAAQGDRAQNQMLSQKVRELKAAAKRARERAEKVLAANKSKLKECENIEELQKLGELIVANLYKIKRGDKSVTVENYYTGKETVIPLDGRLSPAKNAQAYFDKVNKLKRAKEYISKKNTDDEALLSYVLSIEEIINRTYADDDAEIREELLSIGALPKRPSENRKKPPVYARPLEYEFQGFKILCGKNNLQNDRLTFKTASSNDIWLHLKHAHGPHCVVLCGDKQPTQEVIKVAAEIAAQNQKAECLVDYTLRRHVKRVPGGHPGQVTYTDYKTISVTPDPHYECEV